MMKDEYKNSDDFNPLKEGRKNSDFKVPESYFTNFKRELDLKIKAGQKDEFNVPDGYFEESRTDIFSIAEEQKVIHISNRKRNILWYSISAVAATIAIVLTFNIKETPDCETFACLLEKTTITQEDIEYLEENEEISFFDDEEF